MDELIFPQTSPQAKFARGWYVIACSHELDTNDVKPLRYFSRDFVLYRQENGKAVLLDAHCPHLGAHLGIGGKVDGQHIRCPFHAWEFDSDGICLNIPYAKHMPKKAKTKSYTLHECNGVILLWYCEDERQPEYEIQPLSEYQDSQWQPWQPQSLSIKTQPAEVLENVADSAHFLYVHGLKSLNSFSNQYHEHIATQYIDAQSNLGNLISKASYFGPGYQITQMSAFFETRLLNANTPIDENTIQLWFAVMMKKTTIDQETRDFLSEVYQTEFPEKLDETTAKLLTDTYIERTRQGYLEDVQIWEHKKYRTDPILCDGDGPISKLRKWYQQFF